MHSVPMNAPVSLDPQVVVNKKDDFLLVHLAVHWGLKLKEKVGFAEESHKSSVNPSHTVFKLLDI
jgi:hypothetical protein